MHEIFEFLKVAIAKCNALQNGNFQKKKTKSQRAEKFNNYYLHTF